MNPKPHMPWTPNTKLYAHLLGCILCGASEGYTTVFVQARKAPTGAIGLTLNGIGNHLCPGCKAKYVPMDQATRRRLDKLSNKIWPKLKKRGCPCCSAGLEWRLAEEAH
jgi:hypothetical protein